MPNDKTGVGNGSGEWQTPPELFDQLDALFVFNFDAFASPENALCDSYAAVNHSLCSVAPYGPVGRDDDGLTHQWNQHRVFCNPPYSRGFVMQAVEKAISERDNADVIVMLLPASVDTKWYRLLEKYATIWILPSRVKFINPETGEPGTDPPTGHIVAMLRPSWMDR